MLLSLSVEQFQSCLPFARATDIFDAFIRHVQACSIPYIYMTCVYYSKREKGGSNSGHIISSGLLMAIETVLNSGL
jgi:hypothetical protein